MEQVLDILDRSLQGDTAALTFIERTASIYVLNYNAEGKHTTYGCWDFMNQALNEIERLENNAARAGYTVNAHIEPHVQLLCKMCQGAARRGRESDRQLIGTCLANAGITIDCMPSAQSLVDSNCHMRERVMGRLATSAFDFSYANFKASQNIFSNPSTMDQLCGILAANVIASGPYALKKFALEWLIPSATSMPSFSVVSIVSHLGNECLTNSVPDGTNEMIRNLTPYFVSKIISPILADAFNESDVSSDADMVNLHRSDSMKINFNHRLSALSLRALERLCKAVELSINDLANICEGSESNIIEILSDALYSNIEIVSDAVADLFESLLEKEKGFNQKTENIVDGNINEDLDIQSAKEKFQREAKVRDSILSELVSAIGLQRFRFVGRQSNGDIATCRCLTRIAATIGYAAQHIIRLSLENNQQSGIVDLLFHAVSHKSIHISAIALEVIPSIIASESSMSSTLLPILQERAIWAESLVTDLLTPLADSDIDFDEFENFRENVLTVALVSCYRLGHQLYLASCISSIEEICRTRARSKWRQLEASLFCLNAISADVNNNEVINTGTNFSQTIVENVTMSDDMIEDPPNHDKLLTQCLNSLVISHDICLCNPLVLIQLCRFLKKFSNWFVGKEDIKAFDLGAKLCLGAFEAAGNAFKGDPYSQSIIQSMTMSPFTEAINAMQYFLIHSPKHFWSSQALAVLAGGWDVSYKISQTSSSIKFKERESLCGGICRVLATLSAEQWGGTLTSFAAPTIEHLEALVSHAESLEQSPNKAEFQQILARIGCEVRLLSTMIRIFNNAAGTAEQKPSRIDLESFEHPSLLVLHRAWSCLTFIANRFSHDVLTAEPLGDILSQAVVTTSQMINPSQFLKQLSEVGVNMISRISKVDGSASLLPALKFVEDIIEVYGSISSPLSSETTHSNLSMPISQHLSQLIVTLLKLSSNAVSLAVGDVWLFGKEQGGGQTSLEGEGGNSKQNEKKSSDALVGIFSTLHKCINSTPSILFGIQTSSPDQPSLFTQAVRAATISISNRDSSTARSAILFLKAVVEIQRNPDRLKRMVSDSSWLSMQHIIMNAINEIHGKLIERMLYGICGHFQRGILDCSAPLLFLLLQHSKFDSIDHKVLNDGTFLLDDESLALTINIFTFCGSESEGIDQETLIDFVTDIWQIHSRLIEGTSNGIDAIKKLKEKYRRKASNQIQSA